MLKIKFYPDSDLPILEESVRWYEKLWKKEGKKIVNGIEKITGLKFRENNINAVVFLARLPSRSYPLSLKANLSDENKLAFLIHELCHRILAGNRIGILGDNKIKNEEDRTFEVHKVLNLILYDLWCKLYGKDFAKKSVQAEMQLSNPYKRAWKWALSKTKKERKKSFLILKKHFKSNSSGPKPVGIIK